MTIDLILGTAGHIDHGKTSLIRALTGVDTDRLPEEKQRGITIELGFAELSLDPYRLGIVDVPGHERFVRNMLAGATGMDIAMLVVAADDSVKPQTREHLEILRLLDLRAGVIALTKCDLCDPDWQELVEEELRELVQDTFLSEARIVRTSTASGEGIDDLRQALHAAAERVAEGPRRQAEDGPFRMAIDRAFTIAGHGTVVTGSIGSGRVALGDELIIEPGGISVRVRGLRNHNRTVNDMHRGQRAAVNLAGIHHDTIQRGQELAAIGHLVPTRRLTVSLSLLASAPRVLKHRARVRIHVGTAEMLANVSLLDRDVLKPGESAPAQLFLNEPAVTVWSQPFILRSESPVTTIGGGRVLQPSAERVRKADETVLGMLADLGSDDPQRRASAACFFAGTQSWEPRDLSRTAGITDCAAAYQQLVQDGEVREFSISPTRTVRLHRLVVARIEQRIEATLRKMHRAQPLRSAVDRQPLATAFRYLGDPALLKTLLDDLHRAGRIRLGERGVTLAGEGPKLSQGERKLLAELIDKYRLAGIQSPSVKDCQMASAKNQQSVPALIALAAADGDLVEVATGYYLHADVDRDLQTQLGEQLQGGRGATLSEIREILATSRKYAVPYCEYLDRSGFTRRDGDLRYLA